MEHSILWFLIGFAVGLIIFLILNTINNRIIRRTQIGDCFEIIHNKRKKTYSICQKLTEKTEEDFKEKKSKINKQTIKTKLLHMNRIFIEDLNGIFDKLDYNKIYAIKTHDTIVKHLKRKSEIKILKNKKKSTRILFETISFLGPIDFLNVLFIQELRKEHLWKTFYEIEFTKIEKAKEPKEPKEIEEPKETENPKKDKQPEK